MQRRFRMYTVLSVVGLAVLITSSCGSNTMSLDEHKAMSKRALQLWAGGNSETLEAVFTQNYINHQEPDVERGVSAKDLSAYEALLKGHHQAFPDSKVKILTQIAEDDLVATRWQFTATQTGEFEGLAPSNKEVTWTGIQIDRFEHGKIAESWVDWDKYRLFAQLGLVK